MGDSKALLGHGKENRRGRSSPSCHYMDHAWKGKDGFTFGGIDYAVEDHWCSTEVGYTIVGYGLINCLGFNLQKCTKQRSMNTLANSFWRPATVFKLPCSVWQSISTY